MVTTMPMIKPNSLKSAEKVMVTTMPMIKPNHIILAITMIIILSTHMKVDARIHHPQ